jgi:hypothetical protein
MQQHASETLWISGLDILDLSLQEAPCVPSLLLHHSNEKQCMGDLADDNQGSRRKMLDKASDQTSFGHKDLLVVSSIELCNSVR